MVRQNTPHEYGCPPFPKHSLQLCFHPYSAVGSLQSCLQVPVWQAMPGAPLSSVAAPFLSSSTHPIPAQQLGVHSPVLPLGPIHCLASLS